MDSEINHRLKLSKGSAEDLLRTLENPPKPNDKLKKALKRYNNEKIKSNGIEENKSSS